jgi:hypothetical protein
MVALNCWAFLLLSLVFTLALFRDSLSLLGKSNGFRNQVTASAKISCLKWTDTLDWSWRIMLSKIKWQNQRTGKFLLLKVSGLWQKSIAWGILVMELFYYLTVSDHTNLNMIKLFKTKYISACKASEIWIRRNELCPARMFPLKEDGWRVYGDLDIHVILQLSRLKTFLKTNVWDQWCHS